MVDTGVNRTIIERSILNEKSRQKETPVRAHGSVNDFDAGIAHDIKVEVSGNFYATTSFLTTELSAISN